MTKIFSKLIRYYSLSYIFCFSAGHNFPPFGLILCKLFCFLISYFCRTLVHHLVSPYSFHLLLSVSPSIAFCSKLRLLIQIPNQFLFCFLLFKNFPLFSKTISFLIVSSYLNLHSPTLSCTSPMHLMLS